MNKRAENPTDTAILHKARWLLRKALPKYVHHPALVAETPAGNHRQVYGHVSIQMIYNQTDGAALGDHTTREDIRQAIQSAIDNGNRGVCFWPKDISKQVLDSLLPRKIQAKPVIAFPSGCHNVADTLAEINLMDETYKAHGYNLNEFDVVAPVQLLLEDHETPSLEAIQAYFKTLKQVVSAHPARKFVIIRCGEFHKHYGQDSFAAHLRIAISSLLVKLSGAYCVKTNTGKEMDADGNKFGTTLSDVCLMRRVVGNNYPIKAAGGVKRTLANRIYAWVDYYGASSY